VAKLQAIRGMNDILPEESVYWQHVELICRELVKSYGYHEIRTPIVESTALFKRSIGDVTDIVEKEMYTFDDRNGDSLSLRPEGTAGCVRAAIEHGLLHNQVQRLWYMGPMFRHERPQKGRYRQFYQFAVEAFGMSDPAIDAEIILLSYRLWQRLGMADRVTLQINSLGSSECRARYREQLVAYFQAHQDELDEDSQRRLMKNPLRILDSKNPAMKNVIANAPKLVDVLDETSAAHFAKLREYLEAAGVAYEVNPTLVRGLDYYCDTVFEWVTDELGAQGTVCAGGRYDALVEMLGGRATPAVGFALGLERLILLMQQINPMQPRVDAYFILVGEEALLKGVVMAEQMRSALPQLSLQVNLSVASLKSQMKKADKSGARWALIMGSDEVLHNQVTIKDLRADGDEQQTVSLSSLIEIVGEKCGS